MTVTTRQKQLVKRNAKIQKEYTKLMAQPGAMVSAVEEVVGKKFKVSKETVYLVIKRLKSVETGN